MVISPSLRHLARSYLWSLIYVPFRISVLGCTMVTVTRPGRLQTLRYLKALVRAISQLLVSIDLLQEISTNWQRSSSTLTDGT